jgi:acetyl esterase/lipase
VKAPNKNLRLPRTRDWRPRGVWSWTLTSLGCLLVAAAIVLAVYMVHPVDFESLPGTLAVGALFFPLHLFVVTAIAAVVGAIAWRSRALFAATAFMLVAALTAFLALWPITALWQMARRENASLSLGLYLANATHLEFDGPQLDRTVEYGVASDGTKLVLDVWLAEATSGTSLRPAIVKVHGGGWTSGSRSMSANWNQRLNQLGYHVFDVDYRMPPPERWKDEVGDVKCALGWVVANAEKYGVDPARIGAMGYSAGANLAMLAAYSVGDSQLPPSCAAPLVTVRFVINLYGPADLPLAYISSGSLDYAQDVLRRYIGGPPEQYPDRYRAVSPITYVGAQTPPTITLLGLSDRIVSVDQALVLDAALTRAGVVHETVLLPATDHGFDFNWGGFGTQIAVAKVERFLQQHATAP